MLSNTGSSSFDDLLMTRRISGEMARPGQRSAAKLLTHDEAWRIAANIGKLPETDCVGILRRGVAAIVIGCGGPMVLLVNAGLLFAPAAPSCLMERHRPTVS